MSKEFGPIKMVSFFASARLTYIEMQMEKWLRVRKEKADVKRGSPCLLESPSFSLSDG